MSRTCKRHLLLSWPLFPPPFVFVFLFPYFFLFPFLCFFGRHFPWYLLLFLYYLLLFSTFCSLSRFAVFSFLLSVPSLCLLFSLPPTVLISPLSDFQPVREFSVPYCAPSPQFLTGDPLFLTFCPSSPFHVACPFLLQGKPRVSPSLSPLL